MRPGIQSVLDILRGQAPNADAPWDAVLDAAREEHVLPLVAARLFQTGLALPPAIRQRLEAEQREATLAAFFWTSQLTSLLRAFAAANIDVIPLKGPSLAERLYGGAALRVSRDLDLLVRQSDHAAAEALLTQLNFVPAPYPDDYHRQWQRDTAIVELHFDVENPLAIDFDLPTAWANSLPGAFHGQPCRLLTPADELLYLCIHAVRHRYERLTLILDISLALDHYAPAGLTLRPQVANLGRLVVLGFEMANRLNPDHPSPLTIALTPQAHQRIQRLADRLWNDLMESPRPALDWQSQHAFYLETELTPAARLLRRLAHMRIALTRLIDADFTYAERFGLRRRWQVWLLRPIRVVFARSHR